MSSKVEVKTDKAPAMPQDKFPFSQAARVPRLLTKSFAKFLQITYGGMVYCSGNIGYNVEKQALVEGSITERTVSRRTHPILDHS